MVYAALDWRPDVELPPREFVLAHPQVVVFHEGWGRAGDDGLVAEEDGQRVGAVWWRLFTEAAHGEGYVDEETPELAIAVVDGFRGRGIGRALMEAMHERGRQARFAASLSASTSTTPRSGCMRASATWTTSRRTASAG